LTKTNEYQLNQLIALFLAEIIRSRRTSLKRAAEISRFVIKTIPAIHSESEALNMLTLIEKDFEEVITLKQVLHFGYKKSNIKIYEQEVKEFAAEVLIKNMVESSAFLQDAAREDMTIQELCLEYPKFCEFFYQHSEKAQLFPNLKQQIIHASSV